MLGVYCRGTDYVALRPAGHPVQPEPEQVIAKAKEAVKTANFDAVYLTTEDENIVADFKKAFGSMLILPNREYAKYNASSEKYIIDYSTNRDNDKYQQGLEYLVSMLLLDECGGLITSLASGPWGFMCLSKNWENFKYLHIFNLGRY